MGVFLGLIFLLLAFILFFIFFLIQRKKPGATLRNIPALERMRKAVFLSVEEGKRLHLSLGNASILRSNNASALVGLSVLERLTQVCMVSDRPPVATSGDGAFTLLSQDTMHFAYRSGNAVQQYHPSLGRMTGVTPFSYAAGTLPVLHNEKVSTNILIGNFGPEVAYLCEATEQNGGFTLAASDSLTAQAVMEAVADEPLGGEGLFALPAYLQATPMFISSIRTQDVLRWVLIATLIGGAVFKLASSIMGIAFQ
jgi:hypothetical protein